jgi:glucokinase
VILAGDFGGTNARLALFEPDGGALRMRWRASYRSGESDWRELVARAHRDAGGARPSAAAIAVAGPVEHGAAQLTNLGWRVSESALAEVLQIPRASVINDLQAAALGLPVLAADDLVVLQAGEPVKHGMRVLCSPGTGLGEAGLQHTDSGWRAIASEGGHATFAPLDDEDRELGVFLGRLHGHVSAERVLSGAGLVALYAFQQARGLPDDPELARAIAAGAGAPAITRAAEAGVPIAVRVLERFVHVLGVEAGNLALTFLAYGGVYLGGGIPPRIRAFLERPTFLRAFLAKGRMGELLVRIPVALVLNSDVGLLGAARHAARAEGLLAEDT